MSNQLQITGGAKVRNLEGVLTGTSGVVSSLGINVPSGIPQLDGSGKILVSQLPNSVMEYKGTWNVATNTPYLVDGVGNAGDVYIVTGAATGGTTHNFGAGPILFYNGDQAIYDGSLWQRASGSSGTVTSVAMTTPTGLTVTGSPITTSGTLAVSLSSGYTIPTTSFLNGLVPYTGATQDVDLDTHVLNAQALHVKGTAGAGHLGLKHQSAAATGSANESLIYANVDGDLAWKNDNLYLTTLNTHANTADRTYTFPDASGTLALTSDLSSYVPTSRTISTTAPLQGGGDLSANRTLSITQASASTNGYLSSTDWNTFNNKQNAITNPVTGVGSADSVAYWNSSSNITYDSTFYYSASNKRLGVNTNTPNATIGGNIAIDGGYGLLVKNADNNYNGLGIGIDSTYGNLIASQKLGTASARNVTILNQSGYHSLTEAGSFGLNILTPTASPSGVGSVGIDVYGGSNAAGIGFHNVASGVGNTNGAYIYLTNALSLTLRNLEGSIVSSSLGDFSVITNSTENFRVNASTGSLWQSNITSAVLKANSSNVIVAAVAGTDYQAPITLTTTGSSGAATFSSNTLNVPNYTLSGLGGVPTSRTLTINGTAYDLSADRSWSVGTLTGGGADGRVAFWNGASNVVSDSLFVWDDTNNRLGIGLVNPQRSLEIYSASPDTHLRLSGAAPSVSMGEAITGSIYQAKFGLATASNQFVTGSVAGDFVINNQTGSTIWAYNSTEKMRLDTNGNLGVGGIANSSYRLHVFGTGTMLGIETTAASNVYLRMLQAGTVVGGMYYNNSDSTLRINNNNGGLRFDTSTVNGALTIASTGAATFSSSVTSNVPSGTGTMKINNSDVSKAWSFYPTTNGSQTNLNLYEEGTATTVMTFKSGGNVGIGTSNPYVKLDVRGGAISQTTTDFVGGSAGTVIYMRTGATTGNTSFGLIQVGNTGDTTGGNLVLNQFGGNVLIGTTTDRGYKFQVSSSGFFPQFAAFGVNDDGRYIGQGNQISGAFQTYDLTIVNYATSGRVTITNGTTGVVLSNGASSWSAFSDERLKDINSNIENAVEKLSNIRAVNYSWKSDESKKENLGLIAQDVEKVFPQIIDKNKGFIENDENEYLTIRYTELVPVLVKAIQEQNEIITKQGQAIEELKALINK